MENKVSIGTRLKAAGKNTVSSYGSVLIAVIALSIVWSFASPYFLTAANFKNIGVYMSASGIIAAGVTVSMLLGGLDLSQMATMAMSGIFVGIAYNHGVHGVGLLFVAIGVGLVGGIINGLIMNYLHIDPIITTLGTQLVFRAIAYIASDGNMIKVQDELIKWIGRGKIAGIPVTMIIMILVYIIIGIVLKYTRFGRNVISVGGSSEAAYLSGINVKKTRAIAFMISGACAGLATMLYIAQGYVAQPNQGAGADMDCIAAVIIGATLFKRLSFVKGTTAAIVGSILYKACIQLAISLGLPANLLKLVTAVLFLLILILGNLQKGKVKRHA